MPDREEMKMCEEKVRPDGKKIVKGLKQHCNGSMFDRCSDCPYCHVDGEPFACRDELIEDVLSLLSFYWDGSYYDGSDEPPKEVQDA